jgi:decaprenylphospho-beta-D-erythro-pentofuranosid-2-ulose 2-reductase
MKNAVGDVQRALLLGGRSEIGLAIVEALARRGLTRVTLGVRSGSDLSVVSERLAGLGVEVEELSWDAVDTASHGATIASAFTEDVDLVIFAAGVLGDQAAFDNDPASAADALQVNYVGAVSSLLHAANAFRAQGHGSMVVLSSIAGERVRRANFVYGSSKAGADSFAQGLGDHLEADGIGVMVVRPGFVHSAMTEGLDPAPFATTPDRVAADVVAGLERGSEVVWSPPILRVVGSVFRHLPRAVFRRLPM